MSSSEDRVEPVPSNVASSAALTALGKSKWKKGVSGNASDSAARTSLAADAPPGGLTVLRLVNFSISST